MSGRAALQDSAAPERVTYHTGARVRMPLFLLIVRILLHNADSTGGITLLRGQVRRCGLSPKVGGHRLLNRGAVLSFGHPDLLTIQHELLQTFTRKNQSFEF